MGAPRPSNRGKGREVSPSPQPVRAAGLTPTEAEALVRRTVTGTRPLLFPANVAQGWRADVEAETDFFNVAYYSPDRTKRVTLAIVVPNLATPTDTTLQTFPKFHGDRNSLYQVQNKRQARGLRDLVWIEPGHPAQAFAAQGGVPYLLSSTGLTDAEFWAFANALRAVG